MAIPRSEEVRFTDLCTARGVPALRIGMTDDAAQDVPGEGGASDGPGLVVEGLFTVTLAECAEVSGATLPRTFA